MKTSNNIESLLKRYLSCFDIWHEFNNKNIVITGGKGTVGTSLIYLLLKANYSYNLNLKLFVSTREPTIYPDYYEKNDPIMWIKNGLEPNCLSSERIDYIFHCACPTDRNYFKEYPVEAYLTIVRDTERMLNLCRQKNAKMLFLSSDAEFGSIASEEPVNDTFFGPIDPLNTRSCYPLGKKSSVFLCSSYAEEYGTNVNTVRLSIVTGLFQKYDDPKVMSYFLRCLCESKNIILNTSGETKKQLLFSLDAAMACLFAINVNDKGKVFNATNTDICMSIKDYAEHLANKFGKNETKVVYQLIDEKTAGFAAPSQLEMKVDSLSKLGWKPLVGLDDIFNIDLWRFKK